MSKKIICGSIWLLCFILSVFLLMFIPKSYTLSIWVTLVFDIIAYISQLLLWTYIFRRRVNAQGLFYKTPILTLSIVYMTLQLIICIIIGIFNDSIGFRTSLIVNFFVCLLIWIIILMLRLAEYRARTIDLRQIEHHTIINTSISKNDMKEKNNETTCM
ncbi:MAG: hypothetical protein E7242_04265 [Lachnospiraceae bacterium]|nr:hypothetical protein [Lachnospiraceae bacterium]